MGEPRKRKVRYEGGIPVSDRQEGRVTRLDETTLAQCPATAGVVHALSAAGYLDCPVCGWAIRGHLPTPEHDVMATVTDALENEYEEGQIIGWAEEAIYIYYNPQEDQA